VIVRPPFMTSNLNYLARKSFSRTNSQLSPPLHAHRSKPPHSPTAFRNSPNTFRKPRFVSRPLGQFCHSSPHNSYHNSSLSPRNPPPPQPHDLSTNHSLSTTAPTPRQYSPCQICGKSSHRALDCYHCMDYAYQ
jgi:hypothetical protein